MRIFLVGFMGCGKTSIGRKLAARLNTDFIDLDDYIERNAGKSIREIFETDGEDQFRSYEHKSLMDLNNIDNIIVATGGGAPCFSGNMDLINESGLSIYIEMDPLSLANRLKNSTTERPLISGKSEEELLEFIKTSLQQREKTYKKSKITIQGLNLSLNLILKKIHDYINE